MKEVCNKSDLESQLQKSKRILALFYASWCPFCRSFLPVFERSSSEQGVNLILLVKVDDYDNQLWDEYSIEAVPAVILFNEGNICKRLDARLGCGLSEQQLKQWLEREKP
jgi:thioredoxin 1